MMKNVEYSSSTGTLQYLEEELNKVADTKINNGYFAL